MADIGTLLTRNLHEVFGERDAAKRKVRIAEIWRDDGTFIDPFGSHIGHGALDDAVVRLHAGAETARYRDGDSGGLVGQGLRAPRARIFLSARTATHRPTP
jgi:hypothetical protein